jgi:hypothetical protein
MHPSFRTRWFSISTRSGPSSAQHLDEIRAILSSVPGFKAYHALRTGDGGLVTMTVCEDQSGTQESSRRAAEWVRNNLTGLSLAPPEITEGEAFLSF